MHPPPPQPCPPQAQALTGGTHPVHVFILEEQHIRVSAVLPELLHMLKPGAVAHCGDKGTGVTHHREGAGFAPCLGRAPLLLPRGGDAGRKS